MTPLKLVAFDYETATIGEDGSFAASTEAHRHDFRVTSAAFAWKEGSSICTKFTVGEEKTAEAIEQFIRDGFSFIVHNLQFEMMVTNCRFPSLSDRIQWHADTMRLVQNFDNGADEFVIDMPSGDADLDLLSTDEGSKPRKATYIGGLGLAKATRRLLGDSTNHKDEAYSWLRDNGVKKGQEGANLHLLPHDILERYNVADAVNTLRLYEYITYRFRGQSFDWTFDHRLFFYTVHKVVESKIRGVRVDVKKAKEYASKVTQEIEEIGDNFRKRFEKEIATLERARLLDQVRKRSTFRGRRKFLHRFKIGSKSAIKAVRFNPFSGTQLAALFVDQLGIVPKFLTATNKPSFRSVVLGQYGEGGLMLQKRRKRLLVLKQTESLITLCEYDSRFHIDIKACGTSTGRMAGGNAA